MFTPRHATRARARGPTGPMKQRSRSKADAIGAPAAAAPCIDPLKWLGASLLVIAVFIAYRPAASGSFIWDDDEYVALNPNLRWAGGLSNIWFQPTRSPQYYPVTFTSFWIEYHLWGVDPRGYHEVNI